MRRRQKAVETANSSTALQPMRGPYLRAPERTAGHRVISLRLLNNPQMVASRWPFRPQGRIAEGDRRDQSGRHGANRKADKRFGRRADCSTWIESRGGRALCRILFPPLPAGTAGMAMALLHPFRFDLG